MARDGKDRSATWILEHHADSLLHLANVTNFTSWSAAATVLTFPKRVPDGLIDVTFPNRPTPDPFLIEIESYPEQDSYRQLLDDVAMVILTRGVLPDVILLVLAPKGNLTISPQQILDTAHRLTELRLKIRVVNLWTLSAEVLLAANDVGLIPWVPLTDYAGTPESLLQRCKEQIDHLASPREKPILTAATRVMAEMRYNDAQLLSLLGGPIMSLQKVFDSSPSIQWYKANAVRQTTCDLILRILIKKFGSVPEELAAAFRLDDQKKLDVLVDPAIECTDLDTFRTAMTGPA